MRSAWDLHRAWPESDLQIVPDAGHSAFEEGITARLVQATDDLAQRLAGR
jgi:proline iminopeptidase